MTKVVTAAKRIYLDLRPRLEPEPEPEAVLWRIVSPSARGRGSYVDLIMRKRDEFKKEERRSSRRDEIKRQERYLVTFRYM